jgi:hypothetical protein
MWPVTRKSGRLELGLLSKKKIVGQTDGPGSVLRGKEEVCGRVSTAGRCKDKDGGHP